MSQSDYISNRRPRPGTAPTLSPPPSDSPVHRGKPRRRTLSARAQRLLNIERNAVYRRVFFTLGWVAHWAYFAFPGKESWTVMLQAFMASGLLYVIAAWFKHQSVDIPAHWAGWRALIGAVDEHNVIVIESISFVCTLVGAFAFFLTTPSANASTESLDPGVLPANPWQYYIDITMGVNAIIMLLYLLALLNHHKKLEHLDTLHHGAIGALSCLHYLVKCVGYAVYWCPAIFPMNWILLGIFVALSAIQYLLSRSIIPGANAAVLDSIPFLILKTDSNDHDAAEMARDIEIGSAEAVHQEAKNESHVEVVVAGAGHK